MNRGDTRGAAAGLSELAIRSEWDGAGHVGDGRKSMDTWQGVCPGASQ